MAWGICVRQSEGLDVSKCAVAIVGAGLAGLCAARLLQAQGIDFILIEARDRLGGRIFTANQAGLPCEDGFDLGPSWYWPHMQPAIGALVEELGLTAFCQSSDGDVIFERMSRESPQRYRGLVQEQQSMRLVGGTAALVRALAQELPIERIQLNTQVTAMALTEKDVELSLSRAGGEVEKLTATQVIAALPPRLLEATVSFMPAQDAATAQRWRDTPTWMAPHAKFFALYERPFWRDAGLSGTAQSMVGPMVEMHDATTASGGAALFGFLGVAAEQRAALGEETLARACLNQFARIFGAEASHPRATLFKDWATDPLTSTAADRAASGHIEPGDELWVSGPWREHLALAGSETSQSDPGYLAGAVVAANRAVARTLARFQCVLEREWPSRI
ncbi:MAG TPA: FAD-dependent oxidoreductase [Steroidobacter sp.]|nr:FAD-dependent oxidoreductase [Steroidobacter sp.]